MPNPDHTPEVPPVDIKKGLATWLGVALTVVLGLGAILTDVVNENPDLPPELLAKIGGVIAGITILGRMLQSAALLFGLGKSPSTTVVNVPPTETVQVVATETAEPKEEHILPISRGAVEDDLFGDETATALYDDPLPQHNGPGTDLHDARGA